MLRRTARLWALSLLFVCVRALPAQQAAQQVSPLAPPANIQKMAERTELLGNELGTMWTFENAPLDYWKQTYGFTATKEWLDHVRLSSVRFGESCSSSFVSPNGLVLTNHHCARECVEANSKGGVDYVVSGFYAATRAEEKLCPGLFLDQLQEIENVTARVQGAAKPGATAQQIAEAQESVTSQIKDECEKPGKFACEVVSLYHGGQYQLYKYKRYSPVKLVFAPELQAGFFGGDPDNFTYPRYDLDVSFVRAYDESGSAPAKTPHYFQWRAEGAREGDLVFVTGNPGSTSRQITVAQVMYEREFRHPFIIQYLRIQRDLLKQMAAQGPEAEQQVRENIFEIENSLKAYEGEYTGLQDSLLLGQKVKWEREFRTRVDADANLKAQYGDVWSKLTDIEAQKMYVSPRLNTSNPAWLGAPTLLYAYNLVRYVRAKDLPEAQRPEDLRGEAWQQLEQMLKTPDQPDPAISAALLRAHMEM